LTRLLRTIALLVLMIGAVQIAMCAADCDCFLPATAGISGHSSSQSDADGCLCCAQNAQLSSLIDVPELMHELFVPSKFLLQIPKDHTLLIDLPPRS
jgi:hypothetical protein